MLLRTIVSKGDLVVTEPTMFGFGPWRPQRNLSQEVRELSILTDEAESKYRKLAYQRAIASANVADELETLQVLLMNQSNAYFESLVDVSILEKREGVRYKFNRSNGNNKQGASSNKENQNKQKQQQQKKGQSNGRSLTLLEMLTRAKITVH